MVMLVVLVVLVVVVVAGLLVCSNVLEKRWRHSCIMHLDTRQVRQALKDSSVVPHSLIQRLCEKGVDGTAFFQLYHNIDHQSSRLGLRLTPHEKVLVQAAFAELSAKLGT